MLGWAFPLTLPQRGSLVVVIFLGYVAYQYGDSHHCLVLCLIYAHAVYYCDQKASILMKGSGSATIRIRIRLPTPQGREKDKMIYVLRKPVYATCEQQMRRPEHSLLLTA